MFSAARSYESDLGRDVPEDAVSPPRPARVPTSRPEPRRLRWPIAVSVLLHSAAAVAIMPWAISETGTRDEATEAISIELVASNVIEQAVTDASADAQQSLAATAVTEGEAVEAVAAASVAEPLDVVEPTEAGVEEISASRPVEVQNVISGEAAESDLVVQEPQGKIRDTKRKTVSKKSVHTERSDVADVPAKTTDKGRAAAKRAKGGVVTRGTADRAAAGGRVSASAGSIAGYAARVRARVAANKPSARGRGTAVVSFRVTNGGGLVYARLARSSGVAAIDQAAVSAVRRSAPFPSPPAGASAGQLAFTIPFHFR